MHALKTHPLSQSAYQSITFKPDIPPQGNSCHYNYLLQKGLYWEAITSLITALILVSKEVSLWKKLRQAESQKDNSAYVNNDSQLLVPVLPKVRLHPSPCSMK